MEIERTDIMDLKIFTKNIEEQAINQINELNNKYLEMAELK